MLALTAAAAGFATATLKSARIAHPILTQPAFSVEVAGFVEVREERERSDRVVVRALKLEGARLSEKPERVRVSVRKGTAPPVGSYVTFKARLNPPLAPLRPGGYDFARDLYFQRIGATGFVLGAIRTADAAGSARACGCATRRRSSSMRDAIDGRIRAVVPGDKGAIASALITGKRDAISAPVNEAMYVSSLAHVLSISGYHMARGGGRRVLRGPRRRSRWCRDSPAAGRSRNGPRSRRSAPRRSICCCRAPRSRRSAPSS